MTRTGKRAAANGVHVFPVRVYYEDTDAAGVVYYANYLRFAERARTEMLRGLGGGSRELMETQGLAFAVRRCSMEFMKPAWLDDLLEVETRLTDIGGASLVAVQRVKRQSTELVRMEMTLACLSTAGKPARLPPALRTRLKDFQATEH
ncbi:MAG: tol-pal system-associated acyl-CoA thioesterase [Rhodospirillales bacterium]|nr:tol-pal system-associated acyl-CoA thioesterase [Rhodospirillales bacterium]